MELSVIRGCLKRYSRSRAVLFTGPTGVGKSSFWKDIAKERDQPYLDIRLGQMTEGDLLGLYEIADGRTVNLPPEWFMEACERPCVVHFDELNRALATVIQGVFQIILDRRLGKHKLHDETQVAASINIGPEYDVIELDPALLNRFARIEFEPSIDEFLTWGEKHLHPDIVSFLSRNRGHIECRMAADANKVFPTRRSWEFMSEDLWRDLEAHDYSFIYHVARTEVGEEAGASFLAYLNDKKTVSHLDILDKFSPSMLEELGESELARLTDNTIGYILADGDFNKKRQANFAKFAGKLPDEFAASLWRKAAGSDKVDLLGKLLKPVIERVF